ncbi:hypothetical protein A2U01_0095584, partial [Trifolium medium]|nr:hypothetical protein [Trifolium medium]
MSSAIAASAGDAGSTLPGSDSPPQTLVGPPQTPLTGDAAHTDPRVGPESIFLN